jgi:hypothetical protein
MRICICNLVRLTLARITWWQQSPNGSCAAQPSEITKLPLDMSQQGFLKPPHSVRNCSRLTWRFLLMSSDHKVDPANDLVAFERAMTTLPIVYDGVQQPEIE